MDDAQFARFMDLIQDQFQQIQAQFQQVNQRFDALEKRFESLHSEMLERFQSVYDRLDAIEQCALHTANAFEEIRTQLAAVRADVAKLTDRLYGVEVGLLDLTNRVNVLYDDMRQRFRGVTERLTAVEQRLAA